MAKVLGIIAEYDPFHNGHAYHLGEALRLTGADTVITVMSGDFTQRGEPALTDKWSRAEAAIRAGSDLVVEMPVIYAVNNAGYFARAGVGILEALGADFIAFGSETADIEALKDAAFSRTAMSDAQESELKALVKEGLSYPRALGRVLGETEGPGPNDSLAIEYLRYMRSAEPVTIPRVGPGHGEASSSDANLASATQLRRMLRSGEDVSGYVPETTLEILKREEASCGFGDPEKLFTQFASLAARADITGDLREVYGAEEGLANKFTEKFRYTSSWEELVERLKSKRYTRTRVQRTLIHMLLGLTRDMVKAAPLYGRILAMNDRGAEYLRGLKDSDGFMESGVPVIDNVNRALREHPELEAGLRLDILAADIYNISLGRDLYSNSEYVKNPLKF